MEGSNNMVSNAIDLSGVLPILVVVIVVAVVAVVLFKMFKKK